MSSGEITQPAWRRSTLAIALIGSVLMWVSLPPLAWGWLGWFAPIPWLLLIRMDELPGWRPYRALYLGGLAFWMAAIYWILLPLPFIKVFPWLKLPSPIMTPLWFALAAYLAIYVPVFVGLSRVALHRFSVPLWLAAPIVWTGLELARAHVLTGFLMASLAHTQVKWIALIQISDLVGEYGVDFVLMLTAACIASVFSLGDSRKPQLNLLRFIVAPLPAAVVVAATLIYGHFRLAQTDPSQDAAHHAGPRVALIQGNSLADWKSEDGKQKQIMEEYVRLSEQAVVEATKRADRRPPDLIVWPETMYRNPLRDFEAGFQLPTDIKFTTAELMDADRQMLKRLADHLQTPLLVGIDRMHFPAGNQSSDKTPLVRSYNSAALIVPGNSVVTTYDKVHLVMFGEYVPFSHWLPFLDRISSLTGSVEAGEGPVALCANGVCYAPNICYETAIPHVIRHQVATLRSRNESPVALVNLTNDAWYWGSSELDMHVACDVFRAVETRLPIVIAANGGISAFIDSLGRIREESPRQETAVILADIEPGYLQSSYVRFGDWFPGVCLACCVALAFVGWKSNRNMKETRRHGDKETRR